MSAAKMRKRKCITLVKIAYLMTTARYTSQSTLRAQLSSVRKMLAMNLLSILWIGVFDSLAQCTSPEQPVAVFTTMELTEEEWPTQSKDAQIGLQLDTEAFSDWRLH